MRIGLFGGTFDPIHEGHLAIARGARDLGGCARVLLVVARQPPHKERIGAPPEDRLAMVRLAIAGEPRLEASDVELRRDGPSYSIDTVRELTRAHPGDEIAIVLGSDSLPELAKWREAAKLLLEATPLVAPRRGFARADLDGLRSAIGDEIVDRLARGWLDLPLVDVSSRELRPRLARGEDASGLVPPAVVEYVRRRGLYRE